MYAATRSSSLSETQLASIQLSIKVGEGFPGIGVVFQQFGTRYGYRAGETPCYEYRLTFGREVRQISFPEHKNAGGKITSGTVDRVVDFL
jgi:hypothetical protein